MVAIKDQQVREVVEGLGLGLVSLGVTRVTSGKVALELAFSHAWRRWEHASQYPSITRAFKPDNLFWIGVGRSERRNSAAVVWRNAGREYEIGFRWDDWLPAEIADLIGSRPLDHWVALSAPFRDHLQEFD